MALLYAYDFTGTSGTPSAFTQATAGGSFTLSANQGVMSNVAGGYVPTNWACTAGPTVADSDQYVDMVIPDLTEMYPALVARSPANNTAYTPNGIALTIAPAANNSQLFLNGTIAAYGSGLPSTAGVWRARLRVAGTSVKAKVWLKSNPEPSAWDIDITQTTVTTAGQGMLSLINPTAAKTVAFDNYAVYDAAGIPIVLPKGAPAGLELVPFPGVKSNGFVDSSTVVNNGRTFVPIVVQNFTTPAAIGAVRSAYPSMGFFTPGQMDTSNFGRYDPDKVLSVHDGLLDFYLHTDIPSAEAQANGAPSKATPLVACVMPDNYTPITYGRAVVRYRVVATVGVGFKFVPMFWPMDDDWNKGEIDFVEFDIKPGARTRPANATPGTLGQGSGGGPVFRPDGEMYAPDDVFSDHVGICDWTPDGIFIYHDGILQAQIEASRVPTTPMRVELQAETWINQGLPAANAVAHILVSQVATYRMQDTAARYDAATYDSSTYS